MTDFGGKTSIFNHPVYLFLRKFSLQDSRGGSLLYRPGELSLCRLSTGNGIWPSVCNRNDYAYGCPEFQPNIIHP
ncbi:hypothetical protein D9G97_25055 [Escherichia coli]|nr:hypothetical protein [Escherichia coli]